MNETIELLSARRAVAPRLLAGPAPSEAEVEKLLTIASRVPDHGRLVPWRFIVIEHEGAQRIGELIAGVFVADNPDADVDKIATERGRLARAPLVVAVVSRARPHAKIPEVEQLFSAGAACMNLVLAANAMGYATNWLTEWYAYDRRVLAELGLAPDETVAGFIHIGTPTEASTERPRPKLDEIVTHYTGKADEV